MKATMDVVAFFVQCTENGYCFPIHIGSGKDCFVEQIRATGYFKGNRK
jgi:hypothetical protein